MTNISVLSSRVPCLVRQQQFAAARNAYTLLEMLLAISLMTILIAAIAITTGALAQVSTESRQRLKEASVVDCLIDDLLMDIKAAVRNSSPPSLVMIGKESDQMETGLTAGTERVLSWDSDQEGHYVGLAGDTNALLITRDGTSPRFSGQSSAEAIEKSSVLNQTLLWMSPSVSQSTFAAEISGTQIIDRTFVRPDDSPGLIRAHVMGRSLRTSMATREVADLMFRYWDGNRWVDDWNSFQRNNQLPAAIEIGIRLSSNIDQWRRYTCALERPIDPKTSRVMVSSGEFLP